MQQTIVAGIYEQEVDRDSAHEMLQQKVLERQQQAQAAELAKQQAKEQEVLAKQQAKEQERLAREQQKKLNVQLSNVKNLLKILWVPLLKVQYVVLVVVPARKLCVVY